MNPIQHSHHAPEARRWFLEPAWLSIVAALLLQLIVSSYRYGRLEQKVDMIDQHEHELFQLLTRHDTGCKPQ